MTTLRKAAKKALEALDRSDYFGWQSNIPVIKSLREALAQPEPEPLTDEEILKIWNDMGNDPIAPSVFSFIACVRKTERAHGIGEKE